MCLKSLDINECEQSPPCGRGNQCTNTYGGYICTCAEGYRASIDRRACVDIGEDFTNHFEFLLSIIH